MVVERYIGLMSGSSLDGVDIAVVDFTKDGEQFSYFMIDSQTIPYPDEWESKLKSIKSTSALEMFAIESNYSLLLANMVKDNIDLDNVVAIGVHGHTISHLPDENITIQLGNGGVIASSLGVDTIIDFRIQDVVKGGKGTPLVSILEHDVLKEYTYFLNLGGIANVTVFDKGIVAFDICACNQVLNYLSEKLGFRYDDEGRLSRSGNINKRLLDSILKLKYHHLSYPKSIDNQWIKDEVIPLCNDLDPLDSLATVVESIAILVAKDLTYSGKMMITGGGAFNNFMMERLQIHLSKKGIEVILPNKELVEYKEAILMAYLAYCRVHGKRNILAQVTGAVTDTCSGAWYKA